MIAPDSNRAEIPFLVGRDLSEGMKPAMGRLLHRGERNQANLVSLAHFFERPAHPHVPLEALAFIGGAFKGGDDGAHPKDPD